MIETDCLLSEKQNKKKHAKKVITENASHNEKHCCQTLAYKYFCLQQFSLLKKNNGANYSFSQVITDILTTPYGRR